MDMDLMARWMVRFSESGEGAQVDGFNNLSVISIYEKYAKSCEHYLAPNLPVKIVNPRLHFLRTPVRQSLKRAIDLAKRPHHVLAIVPLDPDWEEITGRDEGQA
jgi:hypothetical protein